MLRLCRNCLCTCGTAAETEKCTQEHSDKISILVLPQIFSKAVRAVKQVRSWHSSSVHVRSCKNRWNFGEISVVFFVKLFRISMEIYYWIVGESKFYLDAFDKKIVIKIYRVLFLLEPRQSRTKTCIQLNFSGFCFAPEP